MPPTMLHLLRHGEVRNPEGIVYGSLPGFDLSERGLDQAAAAADHLSGLGVVAIHSSPLDRARQTAQIVAQRVGLDVVLDERLVEWSLGDRWAGVRWDDLPVDFPGEADAYLAHPDDLPFAPESIDAVAQRMQRALDELPDASGSVVFVSHQDPIQALRLRLTGAPLSALQTDKPGHGAVVTLELGDPTWVESHCWEPVQGSPFPPVAASDDGTALSAIMDRCRAPRM